MGDPERRRVTRIDPQARNPRRVNVYLDEVFAFSLSREVAAATGVRPGVELDAQALGDLLRRETFQQALDRALRFLSARPRSEQEVRRRLAEQRVTPEVCEAVLERLRQLGLVDDEAFARYWAANRERFNPRGAFALRAERVQKGVPPAITATVNAEVDEQHTAEVAARRRLARWSRLDRETFRRRLGAYLTRRGFSYEVASQTVDRLWREVASDKTLSPEE